MSKIMLLAVALIVSMSVSYGQELKITVVPPDELNSGKYGMFGVRVVDSYCCRMNLNTAIMLKPG